MSDYSPAALAARPYGSVIYLDLPGCRLPMRFTKLTDSGWRRTDGLAGNGAWLTNYELTDLITRGTITEPFTKETQ